METATISIEVDAKAARAFAGASAAERGKLQVLLDLRLRELVSGPQRSLKEVMDDIGAQAAERGLTPEILETLLHED